ncbi:hypothetical protein [Escherichia albertii]|nr:hypothetical protein [Escherichia albertii]EJS1736147.1 hypothetical protein [Escherichia albertii]MCZ8629916.1 hypothetical protein [Escherichia albertii]MCZ8636172.1 hypothetical protein [Escherichia albertii]MCZ8671870.1 hypothetical protein [Escherichia albertii]MCZ8967313.1 hypothetical protein [Escherichia albertii]
MTTDKNWLNRSNKDPGRSLRFTRQPV